MATQAPPALAVAAACVLLGCLPRGKPPVGQHAVADRTLTGVYLSPSEVDGVPSYLLVTGALRQAASSSGALYNLLDLYEIPYLNLTSAVNGLVGSQPVVEGFLVPNADSTNTTIPTDSLGRLVAERSFLMSSEVGVLRVDLAAGTQTLLGPIHSSSSGWPPLVLSPGRTRVFLDQDSNISVFDLDGDPAEITALRGSVAFVGEDLYYVSDSPDWVLGRVRPHGQPEPIFSSTGLIGLWPIVSDEGPQLLLSLSKESGKGTFALLDPVTLVLAPLPPETTGASFVSASPDGHWLLFGTSQWVLVLFDWTTGAIETANASAFGARYCEWRPGHDELWFHTLSGGFSIWKPGSNVITVNAPTSDYTRLPEATDSVFTRDGRHWFSWNVSEGTAISVGSADDPTAPTVPANPHPTATTSHWETPDGRLLVEAWAFDPNRKDMYLVDPDTGTSRVICGGCRTVALGQTRALVLLDWELSQKSGDLSLIDLDTSARTLLAESVYAVAVDRGKSAEVAAGRDALAAGTQVAFLVRNRLASPYDGLWVATLP